MVEQRKAASLVSRGVGEISLSTASAMYSILRACIYRQQSPKNQLVLEKQVGEHSKHYCDERPRAEWLLEECHL